MFNKHNPIILVVDDEPVNVEILANLFSQDYHIKVANNCKTALAIAEQKPQPDLILLDVMMPDLNGFDVCYLLKENPVTRSIPVIFVTAAVDEISENEGLKLGAVDYITKPINRNTTRLRVKNHLNFLETQRNLIERGGFLDALIENAHHGVGILSKDNNWLLLNKTALSFLEFNDLQHANHYPAFSFVDLAYREHFIAYHQQALLGQTRIVELEVTGFMQTRRWLEITVSPLYNAQAQIIASLMVAADISQRKQGEASLRLSAKVLENALEGIVVTDLNGHIKEVNQSFTRITGYTREEVIGKNPRLLKTSLQSDEFFKDLWETVLANGHWQGEVWNRRKDGTLYPEWLSVAGIYDEHGQLEHSVSVFTDISAIKQHEVELEKLAHFDPLTGIPNRVLLNDRMNKAVAQSKRDQTLLAVCYLDLDGFKPVNDELGHNAGDLVLIECAQRINKVIREIDTVARLGGDEFVVLLQGIEHTLGCTLILDRLLAAIATPVKINDRQCVVSASIGVTLYPLDNEGPDILLRHADQAMYIAKQTGKNRYHFFDTAQDNRLQHFNASLQRISRALEQNEFVLFYQPKINLLTGEVVGAEALIRWQHPERGLLAPMEFLPFVQETALEIPVGNWVIHQAITQILEWRVQGLMIEVAINITANHLQSIDFMSNLQNYFKLNPELTENSLQVEILETAALEDFGMVRTIISQAQKLGISFALDDFGTGYSSLTFLRNLPANTIKIDQSFVRNMLNDSSDQAIIKGIIALAEAFDREIIAEGAETLAHLQALADLGCHFAQGYGIAKPMPAHEFYQWCQDRANAQKY
ncbi:MAG: EAL domain-containing protein [Methylovulum sp.]|nr:EAL domain-containing protein [Methylovulum sp.]MCF7997990.1 EAL domain-containing protein [Methylovulum sp.]